MIVDPTWQDEEPHEGRDRERGQRHQTETRTEESDEDQLALLTSTF